MVSASGRAIPASARRDGSFPAHKPIRCRSTAATAHPSTTTSPRSNLTVRGWARWIGSSVMRSPIDSVESMNRNRFRTPTILLLMMLIGIAGSACGEDAAVRPDGGAEDGGDASTPTPAWESVERLTETATYVAEKVSYRSSGLR